MAAAQALTPFSAKRLKPERPRDPQSQRRVNSRDPIIRHDSQAAGERFGLPCGERLPNIEDPKKYKAQQQIFPVGNPRANSEISDELARDLIDYDYLRVLRAKIIRSARCYEDSHSRNQECEHHCEPLRQNH